jgi:nitroimidazol reductase NimA-like FMN-containing flavoprotein (pyridoxamine 5'-phosphate oxidase superfamily)
MREVDSKGVEIIERAACLDLLAADQIGRLGVVEGGHPLILPVNYGLDGESVIFRTAAGTKLDAAQRGPACFEIDGFDPSTRSGWSVVVRGRLEEVTTLHGPVFERIRTLSEPWVNGDRAHVLRLVPSVISGRRVSPQ